MTGSGSATAVMAGPWPAYVRWNRAIADAVYGTGAAGLPAYLDLEPSVLEVIARAANADMRNPREALLEAVRPTVGIRGNHDRVFDAHLERLHRWRPADGDPPPVIGLLAVLCLAAEDMRESDGIAANNYYDRLMPLLGVTSETNKRRVINAYRKASFDLWEPLNGWLESLHGERGLPTAYSYAHAHVGRPLSQALIRAADRAKLEEFFAEQGLDQRSRLSPADMEPLLTAWISRSPSPASHQIQAMWKRSGARERITDIACQLLETWEAPPNLERRSGSVARAAGRHSALRLLALARRFPSPALELNLVGPRVEGARIGHLFDATKNADLAVDLALEDLPDGRWRLAEADEFESKSLVEGAIQLRLPSGAVFERRPRRVVPLKRDDLVQAFVEVERLGLGEDGMILCTDALAAIVNDALTKIARPGFRRVAPSPPGCPPGWVMFTDIQVLVPLFASSPSRIKVWPLDLNVLEPLATSQLIIQGGLQLPGRIRRWSSRAAPEVRAAAEGVDRMTVTIDRVAAFQGITRVVDRKTDEPFLLVDLQDLNLEDGDYEVTTATSSSTTTARTLNTMRLRLRSGSHPNPIARDAAPLVHPCDPPGPGMLFSRPWDGTERAVRGVQVWPAPNGPAELRRADVGVPGWWLRRRDPLRGRAGGVVSRRRISLAEAAASECFQTGAHVLQLPTFYGKPTSAAIEGVCKQCGLVKRFPASYYRLLKAASKTKAPAVAMNISLADLPPVIGGDGAVTAEVALDALTHDAAGPAAWLEQLALQVEPSQLFVDRFIRSLDLLAHIEVRRDETSLQPVAWEVLPPTLVQLASGGYALAGQRSRRIEDAVVVAASRFEAEVVRTPQGVAAPDGVFISGVSPSIAGLIAEDATTAAGTQISVVNGAAHALASVLPPLGAVIESIPRQAMVAARSVSRWSTDIARWQSVGDASVPGAYRLLSPIPVYCVRDRHDIDNGTMRRVDARLAKHSAALSESERMAAYDDEDRTLYLPLGADLPGLYGRTAVVCSGLLPVEDQQHRVIHYRNVPRPIAEHIVAMLGAQGEEIQ